MPRMTIMLSTWAEKAISQLWIATLVLFSIATGLILNTPLIPLLFGGWIALCWMYSLSAPLIGKSVKVAWLSLLLQLFTYGAASFFGMVLGAQTVGSFLVVFLLGLVTLGFWSIASIFHWYQDEPVDQAKA